MMNISINGKPADIVLENEEKISDLLAGIEQWLQGSENRISGLSVDGVEIGANEISKAMERDIKGLTVIDIRTSSLDELSIEALADLTRHCRDYTDVSFEERKRIRDEWESSPAKAFLAANIKDIHDSACLAFMGGGLTPDKLMLLAEERQRELTDPAAEITGMESIVGETAGRLEELPLDIQTGKDARAADTIQLFSRVGEKLLRVLQLAGRRGSGISGQIEGISVRDFLNDFNTALGDLSTAYENQDAVLAGDLAEYELAPRLRTLYAALKEYAPGEAHK